jgi:hypothetical protein
MATIESQDKAHANRASAGSAAKSSSCTRGECSNSIGVSPRSADPPHAGLGECPFKKVGDSISAHGNRPRSDFWRRGWRRMQAVSGLIEQHETDQAA